MRILFLARSLNIGGTERQLVTLARGLAARGHDVTIAVFYGGGSFEAELLDTRVRVEDLRKRGRWDLVPFFGRLVRLVRGLRPQVIHGYLVVPNLLVALLRPFAPSALIVWGVRASNLDQGVQGRASRATFMLTRGMSRVVDLVISNSKAGAEFHVAEGYPAPKVVVVPNGIDTALFAPDKAKRDEFRKRWGVPNNAELVGLVARIDPIKGHAIFLRALADVRRARPRVRGVCVGSGPAELVEALRSLSEGLGLGDAVIWTGDLADAQAVYCGLDIACSASEAEGFSNSVAEAMACMVPCVVTDVGDSARVVGDYGRVVPPNDPEALAAALIDLLDSGPGALGLGSRRRIEAEFSIERLFERTEAALASRGGVE